MIDLRQHTAIRCGERSAKSHQVCNWVRSMIVKLERMGRGRRRLALSSPKLHVEIGFHKPATTVPP